VIDPIFLAEAALNGILLGGILALLALGLNLIFGVIDVVWIMYVDLVMLCMYAMYFLCPTGPRGSCRSASARSSALRSTSS
jgi:branched-subunit amino acid ABC-type transport system permease component